MHEKLEAALGQVRGEYIAEAAQPKKKYRPYWLGAIAAALAVVMLLGISLIPARVSAQVISAPSEPRVSERLDLDAYGDDIDAWRMAQQNWSAQRKARQTIVGQALDTLEPFFADSTRLYLAGHTENRVWSPINGFIALAMLAEVTDGNSRQQVMDALGQTQVDTLRSHVSALWESVYQDDGHEILKLANSLWLQEGLSYSQDTMDALAYHHYASVYQRDLQEPGATRDLQAWLNSNTGGLLTDAVEGAQFPDQAVMTLASTIYLQAKWGEEFQAERNTQGTFHGPGGDQTVTFMNSSASTDYYWGDSYSAISLGLKNGSRMWLILPDEGKTPDDVLAEGQFWQPLSQAYRDSENKKYMIVNLSLPKFDITSGGDLTPMFRQLGITDIFDPSRSDFTAITGEIPIFATAVNQAARIQADEQGVKAASYIELPMAGAGMPPEEVIDFVLDRPFLFVLASQNGIPLFVGLVNQP